MSDLMRVHLFVKVFGYKLRCQKIRENCNLLGLSNNCKKKKKIDSARWPTNVVIGKVGNVVVAAIKCG